ncbi:MAG TPA: flagellar biosynthesis anti-sigma factor FlgM [Xanthomonadales bacterium]|nr:flagellar biosynthesis anti-sigma factor FlgM [Xanthomonadales bacterium]
MVNKIDGMPGTAAPLANPRLERASGDRSQPIAAVLPADSVRLTAEATGLDILQREFAANPGVDLERVAKLREAVLSGSYRIDPGVIADGLLRIERELAG